MMIRIPALLTPEQVSRCTALLADANWIDGRATAGAQAGLARRNLQLSATTAQAQQVGEIVLRALAASPRFVSAALPLKILPPMFNRYSQGMAFGPHIDNAIHTSPWRRAATGPTSPAPCSRASLPTTPAGSW